MLIFVCCSRLHMARQLRVQFLFRVPPTGHRLPCCCAEGCAEGNHVRGGTTAASAAALVQVYRLM
jgi:hypothetical protein